MAWYSYFLLSLPETFAVLALTFVLLGISIKTKKRQFIIFSILYSAIAFSAELYMTFSFKVYLLVLIFALLASFIFKFTFIQGVIVSLVCFICLVFFQTILILLYMAIFSLNIEEILSDPWKRILLANATNIPIAFAALAAHRYKIRVPYLSGRLQ
ncbi:MAG: hypothetical protein AB2392_13160 [Neobacillus sp.]|jgi:hypothetical protein